MKINSEKCKEIPGYSRYVISENGRIYRVHALNKKEKELQENSPNKQFIRESKVQYYSEKIRGRWTQVGLINDKGKFTTAAVEKLLSDTFELWPSTKKRYSIEFKDGNHKNICIDNIVVKPFKPNNSKLTLEQVRDIRKQISKGEVLNRIASKYGVSDMQISRIKSGENWRKGGRVIPAPKAPFNIKDPKIRRFISTFDHSEIDDKIRRPFTIKRSSDPTNNKIIGVVNGFRLSKSHKNISRARLLVFKLNKYFFNEDVAIKTDNKLKGKEKEQEKAKLTVI